MKNDYLEELRELLNNYQMEEIEKQDIITDYEDIYDGWTDKGLNDEEVEKKLGNPRSIIKDLTEGYRKVEKPIPGGEKIIALSPFFATITFLILGIGFDLWHPGWLIFTVIPVTAIFMEMGKTREEHLTTALSPFVAGVTFFILGFGFDLWHPGWIVFIIIPILGVWNSRRDMNIPVLLVSLSPFISGIIYLYLGVYMNLWHPGWIVFFLIPILGVFTGAKGMSVLNLFVSLSPFVATITFVFLYDAGNAVPGWIIFLIIPILGIINEKSKVKMFIMEILIILGIVGYLYLGYNFEDMWGYALITFIPFILYTIYIGDIEVGYGKSSKEYKIVSVISVVIFFALGLLLDLWDVAWLVLLAIPVYAIIKEVPKKDKLVSLSPFLALTIFFLLGYIFNIWEYSWLAFFIIPIVAIVKNVD